MLDDIGRKLLETAALQTDEIEKIVSAPRLFGDIQARIRAGQTPDSKEVSTHHPLHPLRPFFAFWNLRQSGAVFAGLTVLILAVAGLSFYVGRMPSTLTSSTSSAPSGTTGVNEKPSRETQAKTHQVSDRITPPKLEDTEGAEDEPEYKTVDLVFRGETKNKSVLKAEFKTRQPQKTKAETEPEEGFYPLNFTGNTEDMTAGAQIVRVDLPRSSLFSMGVDVPAGNGAETIKTDLLISSDGVTRGFRFVKQKSNID